MDKTIIIAEIKDTDKWYNVTDNMGITYGINKEKAVKLSEQLKSAKSGDQLAGNHVEKDDKHYLWDPNERKASGGKSFAPKDKSFEAAIAAIQAASSSPNIPADKILLSAEAFHKFIMDKATKSTPESK